MVKMSINWSTASCTYMFDTFWNKDLWFYSVFIVYCFTVFVFVIADNVFSPLLHSVCLSVSRSLDVCVRHKIMFRRSQSKHNSRPLVTQCLSFHWTLKLKELTERGGRTFTVLMHQLVQMQRNVRYMCIVTSQCPKLWSRRHFVACIFSTSD